MNRTRSRIWALIAISTTGVALSALLPLQPECSQFKEENFEVTWCQGLVAQAKVIKPAVQPKAASKSKSSSGPSTPEAGVKLLMGILQRIGNEPQLAFQAANKQQQQIAQQQIAQQQENSNLANLFANQADVGKLIRPQQKNTAGKTQTISQMIALAPKMKEKAIAIDEAKARVSMEESAAAEAPMDAKEKSDSLQSSAAGSFAYQSAPGKGEGWQRLNTSVTKLAKLSSAISGIQDWRNEAESQQTRGFAPGNVGNIAEYGNKKLLVTSNPAASGISPPAPMSTHKSEALRDEEGDSDTTALKLKEPGLYRNFREYGTNRRQDRIADKDAPRQIAYIPPSLVPGVPGLHLGASQSDAMEFMASRGSVSQTMVKGWKVLSLQEHKGKTVLQAYVRNGIVEAFRIFNKSYVPPRIGINLDSSLRQMKRKFGEPAFILKEPGEVNEMGVKNYVYPVTQVCFQLARPNEDKDPEVQSLLLFRFL